MVASLMVFEKAVSVLGGFAFAHGVPCDLVAPHRCILILSEGQVPVESVAPA